MAAIAPGAADVRTFWENTLRGVDTITEVPPERWDWRLYYDADPKAPDKITSKWGGFLADVPFDPLRYGMPPTTLPSIEPLHLLTLEAVRAALDDAGYRDRPFPRERTAVVLGAGGGAAQLAMGYAFRSYLPLLDTVIPGAGQAAQEHCGALLPEWTEDAFPGILLNVAAGRVANRFDLGGANYTVDAACGSSLAAAAVAVRELESGAADMVILGGADTVQNPFTYLAFSKTHAFSPKGRCRPFDAQADGIVISEAVAVLVLKRLADAERDGDRIYAVIQGLGASSDGRAKGLTAPRPEGQMRALRRAYERSGIAPDTVGYVEAHGTGTAAGDLSEIHALTEVFREARAERGRCALGLGQVVDRAYQVRCGTGRLDQRRSGTPSQGLAADDRRRGRRTPQVDFADEPVPHQHAGSAPGCTRRRDHPRRAGVSAFGFGGTNFHAVLESYEGVPAAVTSPLRDWPTELLVWRAPDRDRLDLELGKLDQALGGGAQPTLRDLSFTLLTSLEASDSHRRSRAGDRRSYARRPPREAGAGASGFAGGARRVPRPTRDRLRRTSDGIASARLPVSGSGGATSRDAGRTGGAVPRSAAGVRDDRRGAARPGPARGGAPGLPTAGVQRRRARAAADGPGGDRGRAAGAGRGEPGVAPPASSAGGRARGRRGTQLRRAGGAARGGDVLG